MSPPILLNSSFPYVHLHSGLDYQVCALLFIFCRSLARSFFDSISHLLQTPKPSPRARSHHRPRGARSHAQAHVRHDLKGHVHHPQDAHVPPDGPAVEPDEPGEGVRLLLREDLELLAQERVVGVVDLCVGLSITMFVCGSNYKRAWVGGGDKQLCALLPVPAISTRSRRATGGRRSARRGCRRT